MPLQAGDERRGAGRWLAAHGRREPYSAGPITSVTMTSSRGTHAMTADGGTKEVGLRRQVAESNALVHRATAPAAQYPGLRRRPELRDIHRRRRGGDHLDMAGSTGLPSSPTEDEGGSAVPGAQVEPRACVQLPICAGRDHRRHAVLSCITRACPPRQWPGRGSSCGETQRAHHGLLHAHLAPRQSAIHMRHRLGPIPSGQQEPRAGMLLFTRPAPPSSASDRR